MTCIRRNVWLEMVADYLSKESRFTTDATVPDGLSTVDGLRRAAADYRTAVEALEEIVDDLSVPNHPAPWAAHALQVATMALEQFGVGHADS
jgi:hypothetical protein